MSEKPWEVAPSSPCPRCDAPAEQAERRGPRLLRCGACRLVFDPTSPVTARALARRWSAPPPPPGVAAAPSTAVPEGFEAIPIQGGQIAYREGRSPGVLVVRHWWATKNLMGSRLRALAAPLMVLGMGALIVAMARRSRSVEAEGNLIFGLVMAFFIAPVMLYVLAALRFNRSILSVERGRLRVAHGPLPWWPTSTEIPVDDVQQLFVEERFDGREESRALARSADDLIYHYHLRACVRGRTKPVTLASHLSTPEQAFFLESILERAMGIADLLVDGESPMKSAHRRGMLP